MNAYIFLLYCILVSTANMFALHLGKEYLIATLSLMFVMTNVFVMKQITLFGMTATASDALAVGITLGLNLFQERYSRKEALEAIWISFFCSLFFMGITILHLNYIPSPLDITDAHYQIIFRSLPRTIFASFFTFLIVQTIDVFLYGFLKDYFQKRFFVFRNFGTLIFTQTLDTVLFTFLGLYKTSVAYSDLSVIGTIIGLSSIIKYCAIFISVPYVRFVNTFHPSTRS